MFKLHLGCGNKILKDFTNIDIRPSKGVDIVDDISILNNIKNEEVDLIYASHVLEHFGRYEYKNVLKRWFEVLKKDGILRLAVPNFEEVVNYYIKHKDLDVLMGFLYGGQTYKQNYHYCTWDFNTLSNDLKSIGFREVNKYEWRQTEHGDIDDFSQCYLPHMDKENGTLMSLNIEAIK
jgi:predicted SAM-dependent methyltransferase